MPLQCQNLACVWDTLYLYLCSICKWKRRIFNSIDSYIATLQHRFISIHSTLILHVLVRSQISLNNQFFFRWHRIYFILCYFTLCYFLTEGKGIQAIFFYSFRQMQILLVSGRTFFSVSFKLSYWYYIWNNIFFVLVVIYLHFKIVDI